MTTISAIMPLYQDEATAVRALDSALAQTHPPLEIIVVDDGSTDAGPARVRAIGDPRIVVHAQGNAGCGAARNAGIARARGEFVAFIDADDEWLPDFFERAVDALGHHPDVDFYYGESRELGIETGAAARAAEIARRTAHERAAAPPPVRLEPPPRGSAKALKRRIDRHTSTLVARRETLAALGGYYDRDGCPFGGDSVMSAVIHWNHPVLVQAVPVHLRHRLDKGLTGRSRRRPVVRPLVHDSDYVLSRIDPAHHDDVRRLMAYLAALDAARLARMGHVRLGWQVLRGTPGARRVARPGQALPLTRFVLRAAAGALRRRPVADVPTSASPGR